MEASLGPRPKPALSSSHPWVNYQAWGDVSAGTGPESFNWNQTYGPLSWPQHGRIMFTVRARTGDYWKAEDLTSFNGTAWVEGPVASGTGQGGLLAESNVILTASTITSSAAPVLPGPSLASIRRYTHQAQVTIGNMSTFDVIGGSGISLRPQIAGGVAESSAPGT